MRRVSAQRIFDNANVRILLTVADNYGRLRFHSIRSSRSAIKESPGGWKKSTVQKVKDETSQREAWILSSQEVNAVVLPHEWGVELAIGIAAGVGTTAVVELTKWLWRRWQAQKSKATSELPVVRIQVSTSTDKRGRKKTMRTMELTGEISPAALRTLVQEGLALVPGSPKSSN